MEMELMGGSQNVNAFEDEGSCWLSEAPVNAVAASLTTSLDGDENDLVYTAETAGALANRYSVKYVLAGDADADLSAVWDDACLTVTLGTDSEGVADDAKNTAASLKALVNAIEDTPVTCDFATDGGANDGSGVLDVMSEASLTGGINGTYAPSGGLFYVDASHAYVAKAANGVSDANWVRISHLSLA